MTPAFDVLIAGAGRLGGPLARALAGAGHRVAVVRRGAGLPAPGIELIRCDLAAGAPRLPDARCVVCCLSADAQSAEAYDAAYRLAPAQLLAGLAEPAIPRLLVSSSRVYAESGGGWVDEDSPLAADDFRSQALIAGERQWQASGPLASIVRFSGIYDERSVRLLDAARRYAGGPGQGLHWTNRIHRRDAIGVLEFLVNRILAGEPVAACYLASDESPVLQRDLYHWLRQQLGLAVPAAPPAAPGAVTGKRCSSARLRAAGYRFHYPDYRAGYRLVVDAVRGEQR